MWTMEQIALAQAQARESRHYYLLRLEHICSRSRRRLTIHPQSVSAKLACISRRGGRGGGGASGRKERLLLTEDSAMVSRFFPGVVGNRDEEDGGLLTATSCKCRCRKPIDLGRPGSLFVCFGVSRGGRSSSCTERGRSFAMACVGGVEGWGDWELLRRKRRAGKVLLSLEPSLSFPSYSRFQPHSHATAASVMNHQCHSPMADHCG